MATSDQQPDLDVVQHPILGELKFPKDMSPEDRNEAIDRALASKHLVSPPSALDTAAQPEEMHQSEDALGLGQRVVKSAGNTFLSAIDPRTYIHAFGDAPTEEEKAHYAPVEKQYGEEPGEETSGLKRIGLGLGRLTGGIAVDEAGEALKNAALGDKAAQLKVKRTLREQGPELAGNILGVAALGGAAKGLGKVAPRIAPYVPDVVSNAADAVASVPSKIADVARNRTDYIPSAERIVKAVQNNDLLAPRSVTPNPEISDALSTELGNGGAGRIATAPLRQIARHPVAAASLVGAPFAPHAAVSVLPEILGGAGVLADTLGVGRRGKFVLPEAARNVGLNPTEVSLEGWDKQVRDTKNVLDQTTAEANKYRLGDNGSPEQADAYKKQAEARRAHEAALEGRFNAALGSTPASSVEDALNGSRLNAPNTRRVDQTPLSIIRRVIDKNTEPDSDLGGPSAPSGPDVLGRIPTPSTRPASQTGEALGRIPVPTRDITPEDVKSSPGTSMSPEGAIPKINRPVAEEAGPRKIAVPEAAGEAPADYESAVKEQVTKLSNENLKKLGQQYGLDPDKYDFSKREALREGGSKHPVERHKFIADLMDKLPDEEKLEIGRQIAGGKDNGLFADREVSSQGNAEKAKGFFPRLRAALKDESGSATIPFTGKPTSISDVANDFLKSLGDTEGNVEGAEGTSDDPHAINFGGKVTGTPAKPRMIPMPEVEQAAREFTANRFPGQQAEVSLAGESPAARVPEGELNRTASDFLAKNTPRPVDPLTEQINRFHEIRQRLGLNTKPKMDTFQTSGTSPTPEELNRLQVRSNLQSKYSSKQGEFSNTHSVDILDSKGNKVGSVSAIEAEPGVWNIDHSRSSIEGMKVGRDFGYSKLFSKAQAAADASGKPVRIEGGTVQSPSAEATWRSLEGTGYPVKWAEHVGNQMQPSVTFEPKAKATAAAAGAEAPGAESAVRAALRHQGVESDVPSPDEFSVEDTTPSFLNRVGSTVKRLMKDESGEMKVPFTEPTQILRAKKPTLAPEPAEPVISPEQQELTRVKSSIDTLKVRLTKGDKNYLSVIEDVVGDPEMKAIYEKDHPELLGSAKQAYEKIKERVENKRAKAPNPLGPQTAVENHLDEFTGDFGKPGTEVDPFKAFEQYEKDVQDAHEARVQRINQLFANSRYSADDLPDYLKDFETDPISSRFGLRYLKDIKNHVDKAMEINPKFEGDVTTARPDLFETASSKAAKTRARNLQEKNFINSKKVELPQAEESGLTNVLKERGYKQAPADSDAKQRVAEGTAKKAVEDAQKALQKAKGADEAKAANEAVKAAQAKYEAVVRERDYTPSLFPKLIRRKK